MTRRAKPDPMATYGKQLHELLTEAMALAQLQLDVEAPDPATWLQLAERTYRFRTDLSADVSGQGELQAFALELEHTLLARSRLESQPPQRVLFFGQTLAQARRVFDEQMTTRLVPLAEALAAGQSG